MKIGHDYLPRGSRMKIFALSALVGIIAGAVSIIFHAILTLGKEFIQVELKFVPSLVAILPLIVYGLHYLSNRFILKGDTAFGVGALEHELIEIDRFLMKPWKVITKLANTIIALICGFSVGQFGPTLYLGGSIGSNIGYYFKLDKEVIRILIGCGVAAAISAIMHVPLFAVVFVIEVVFAKRYFDYMLPLMIASLTAYAMDRIYTGEFYLFNLNKLAPLHKLSVNNLLLLLLIALVIGVLAGIYVLLLRNMAIYFKKYNNKISFILFLSVLIALIHYFFPLTHFLELSLLPSKSVKFLLLLLILKLVLIVIELSSGIYGGNFSPGIIIGIIFGIIIFKLAPSSYTVGMDVILIITLSVVAMFSGFAHAPLSAVILAIESSGQMSILLPALVIALISHFISDLIAEESLFYLK